MLEILQAFVEFLDHWQTGLTGLLGFGAAEGLATIGSPAIAELWKYVAEERSDDELRLVAFIVHRIDGKELARSRIQLEISITAGRATNLRDSSHSQMKNLRQLLEWFSDAEFFEKEDNWPYRSR